MYLNGVVLVSPTELGIERSEFVKASLRVPYYAATAWYHKALPADLLKKDLTEMLPEVVSVGVPSPQSIETPYSCELPPWSVAAARMLPSRNPPTWPLKGTDATGVKLKLVLPASRGAS